MEQKKYPNSARSFQNARKEKDTHPDLDGEGEIDCPHCNRSIGFWVKTWRKMGGKGEWFSHAFKIKTGAPAQDRQPSLDQSPKTKDEPRGFLNDEIPFAWIGAMFFVSQIMMGPLGT